VERAWPNIEVAPEGVKIVDGSFEFRPLDSAWSVQHIPSSIATWRRDELVGGAMLKRLPCHAARVVVAVLLAACAARHPVTTAAEDPAPPPPLLVPVILDVENHNWADVILYVLHDGRSTRLTQVSAAHDLSIEIPPQLQGEMGIIRLAVRRIGGRDSYVSESISLRGGPSVRLTIESNITRSSVGVW
jgi:hypothetical protein